MKVVIVVLTWNNVNDTVECVRSLLRLEETLPHKIVVVDNGSTEDTFSELRRALHRIYDTMEVIEEDRIEDVSPSSVSAGLILVRNRRNYGFAGGNNRGIRLALRLDADYVWLLNNDTVVDRKALHYLVERVREGGDDIGFVGSLLLYYTYPSVIQAVGGGRFYPWLGGARLLYKGRKVTGKKFAGLTASVVEKKINYVMGASLFVRSDVIRDVGLLDELFFLYGEELDWQLKGKRRGWRLGVSLESRVYHKESLSVGGKSPFYFYHFARGSSIVIKRHFGRIFLPSAFLFLLARSVTSGRPRIGSIRAVVRGFLDGIRVG